MDITSLYFNIQHEIGIRCVQEFLSTDPEITKPQREFFLKAIHFILHNNYFDYNGETYHRPILTYSWVALNNKILHQTTPTHSRLSCTTGILKTYFFNGLGRKKKLYYAPISLTITLGGNFKKKRSTSWTSKLHKEKAHMLRNFL